MNESKIKLFQKQQRKEQKTMNKATALGLKSVLALLFALTLCVTLCNCSHFCKADGSCCSDFSGSITLPGNTALEMVRVEPGTFLMGKQDKDSFDNEKEHKVSLTQGFWIGKYEVTQAQWQAVMGKNPSEFAGNDLPVVNVSWNDCMIFCEKLNLLCVGKLPAGYRFALPTEAQWEFAARGGNKGKGCKYSGSDDIDKVAWYDGNSDGKPHPVGKKAANELGLFDMCGNVHEWCRDICPADKVIPYASDPEFLLNKVDGKGLHRVIRDGSWHHNAKFARSSYRRSYSPTGSGNDLGFRLVLIPVR